MLYQGVGKINARYSVFIIIQTWALTRSFFWWFVIRAEKYV